MPRSQPPSFSDLFSLLLRSRQAREPPSTTRFIFHPERRLFSRVQHVVAQIFAPSTWDDRARNFQRLVEFNNRALGYDLSNPAALDYVTPLWCESLARTTCPATRIKYAGEVAAMQRRMGVTAMPFIRAYQAGLRAMGGEIPQRQAPAISLQDLRKLVAAADNNEVRRGSRLSLLLFLAAKTASRWDEVSRLRREQVLEATPQQIVIYWGTNTKTTRMCPWRTDSWVVVRHLPQVPQRYVDELNNMAAGEPLLGHTSDWGNAFIKKVLGAETAVTCHSLKAGAVDQLVRAVAEGKLAQELVSRLAKHEPRSVQQSGIQQTTLRYARDQIALALALRTQEATILLDF